MLPALLVCKEFRCYRMLIFDRDGRERGRIMERNQLKTADETPGGSGMKGSSPILGFLVIYKRLIKTGREKSHTAKSYPM